MEIFGMGSGGILLVLIVALIIWGPGRIVDIAKTLGKMVHTLKKATFDLTTQITKEMEEKEEKTSARRVQSNQPLTEQGIGRNE